MMDVDDSPSGDEDKNPTFKFTEGRERKLKVKNPALLKQLSIYVPVKKY